jgi:hypothetical protein
MGIFRPRDTARFAEPDSAPVDEPTVELTPLDAGERTALLRLVHRTLWSESLREPEMREVAAMDLALDVRLILLEHPPLPDDYPVLRPSVPGLPGRAA